MEQVQPTEGFVYRTPTVKPGVMAAKSKSRKFAILLQVAFSYLLLGCEQASAQANAGALYLNRKEADVETIAGNATICNGNCGSLNTCSSECSRATCHPITNEELLCTTVDNNEFFDICPAGACPNKFNLDYNRSFVTLPAPGSTNLATEVARDICLQRSLDSTFKTISLQSNYTLVYFGSTSGAFRAFPGREQNETQCTRFDPRIRPWYLNGISVSKDVKILVDVANSMASVVTIDYKRSAQTTYLNVAQNITLNLLPTFMPHDFVEVFSFNTNGAASLVGQVQIGTSYNYSYDADPADRPELAAMTAHVNSLAASANAAQSDLTTALIQVVNSFNTTNTLKVVLVFSDGLFAPLNTTTFPATALKALQGKLMVYKLPTNVDSADPYLVKSLTLQQAICSVNGSFERLVAPDTADPLYSVRSYFTFLALTQLASVGNNATWSNLYASFSQDRTAITVTYPAFGSDGMLIGVAGVDVIAENLPQPLQDQVYAEFQSRIRGTQVAPANIPLTCNYQTAAANRTCPNSTLPDSSAVCAQNDTSSLAERTCCGYGTCGVTDLGESKHLKTGIIVLIAVLAAAAVVIGGGICWCFLCGLRRGSKTTFNERFTGPP